MLPQKSQTLQGRWCHAGGSNFHKSGSAESSVVTKKTPKKGLETLMFQTAGARSCSWCVPGVSQLCSRCPWCHCAAPAGSLWEVTTPGVGLGVTTGLELCWDRQGMEVTSQQVWGHLPNVPGQPNIPKYSRTKNIRGQKVS